MNNISEDLKLEIDALRTLFLHDRTWASPTEAQINALRILFDQATTDKRRSVRIKMLQIITGISRLESSQSLTLHMASTLLNYLIDARASSPGYLVISDQGRKLINGLEPKAVEQAGPYKKRAKKQSAEEKELANWKRIFA
jgi:hypothetical protein